MIGIFDLTFFSLCFHLGVVGDGLTSQMNVWMSKNGGYDWTEVRFEDAVNFIRSLTISYVQQQFHTFNNNFIRSTTIRDKQ